MGITDWKGLMGGAGVKDESIMITQTQTTRANFETISYDCAASTNLGTEAIVIPAQPGAPVQPGATVAFDAVLNAQSPVSAGNSIEIVSSVAPTNGSQIDSSSNLDSLIAPAADISVVGGAHFTIDTATVNESRTTGEIVETVGLAVGYKLSDQMDNKSFQSEMESHRHHRDNIEQQEITFPTIPTWTTGWLYGTESVETQTQSTATTATDQNQPQINPQSASNSTPSSPVTSSAKTPPTSPPKHSTIEAIEALKTALTDPPPKNPTQLTSLINTLSQQKSQITTDTTTEDLQQIEDSLKSLTRTTAATVGLSAAIAQKLPHSINELTSHVTSTRVQKVVETAAELTKEDSPTGTALYDLAAQLTHIHPDNLDKNKLSNITQALAKLLEKHEKATLSQDQTEALAEVESGTQPFKKKLGIIEIREAITAALNPEKSNLLTLDIRVLLTKAHNSGLIELTRTQATVTAFNKTPSEFDVTVNVGGEPNRIQGSLTKYFEACNKLKFWSNTASNGMHAIFSSSVALGVAFLGVAASTAAVAATVAAVGWGVSLLFKNSPSGGGQVTEVLGRTVRNLSAGVAIGAVGGTLGAPFLLGGAITAGIGAVSCLLAHFNAGPRIRSVEDALLETTVRFPTDLETSANLTSEKALVLLLRLYHQIKSADAAGFKHVKLEGRSSFSLEPRNDEANLVATCARPLLEAMQNLINNWDSMSNEGKNDPLSRQAKSVFLTQEFDPKIRQYIGTYLPNFLESLMTIPSIHVRFCRWINDSQHSLKPFWQRVQACRGK